MTIIHTPYGGTEPVELGEGRGDLNYTSAALGQVDDWDGGPIFAGRPVSYARIFAEQTWIAIAVMRLLTWSVRVPLKVYERLDDEGGRRRLRPSEDPLAAAIEEPWARGTMAELVTGIFGPNLVHGNSLTDVISGAGDRIAFGPIDWRTVTPVRADMNDPFSEILGWKVMSASGADQRTVSSDTVMHLAWWSPLGKLGISPLRQLGSTIAAESAARDWTIMNLVQSIRPTGVVTTTKEWLGLEPTERQTLLDQTRTDLRDAYAGPLMAGKVPVFPPGLEWNSASPTTAVEAALIDQRKVNREEAAATYMLPPPMIGILDHATYSNVEQARGMAYTDGLAPPLVMIEQKINAHVCRGILRDPSRFVEFDFAGILRGDRLKEIQAIREAISTAVLTPNEGRDLTGRQRSGAPEADKLYMPTNNLRPIDSPDGNRLRDKSLAAQQFGNAIKSDVVSREEARAELGFDAGTANQEGGS